MKKIVIGILILSYIMMLISTIKTEKENRELEEANTRLERCSLYKELTTTKYSTLDGYYNIKREYYCVWVKNKTKEEIATIDEHEKCHALIAKDTKHFLTERFK